MPPPTWNSGRVFPRPPLASPARPTGRFSHQLSPQTPGLRPDQPPSFRSPTCPEFVTTRSSKAVLLSPQLEITAKPCASGNRTEGVGIRLVITCNGSQLCTKTGGYATVPNRLVPLPKWGSPPQDSFCSVQEDELFCGQTKENAIKRKLAGQAALCGPTAAG